MLSFALLLCVIVSTSEDVAAAPVEQSSSSLLAVVARPSAKTNGPRVFSIATAQTLLESLGRYTCPASNGLLDSACREPMFTPCTGTRPLAVTTDRYVSLRASIEAVADGDVWEWFWYGPNGKTSGPARTTFRENFNGENDCFVFSNGFSTFYICGTRSVEAEWGNAVIHDDNAFGLWNIEVRFNGQRVLFEPFELLLLPHADLKGFSIDNTLASEGALGLEVNLQTAPDDPGIGTKLQLGLSPFSLSSGQQLELSPGPNSLRIKLPDHAIGRFESDAILTVQTETRTARPDIQYSPILGCGVPPISLRSTLAIPLPIVFIHGLIPPDGLTKGQLSTWISGSSIVPGQRDPLFNYLVGATDIASPTRVFDTSDFRLPYSRPGESPYPTLYFGDWRSIAYNDPAVIATQLEGVIESAISNAYARRVNIIGHSAGGVVGRYLVQRGVLRNSVKVSKLILVGSPNNGTSDVYIKSSGIDRSLVDFMARGIAGFMVPPSPDLRGPYLANDPCALISPAPLRRTYDDSIAIPADVRTINIIGVGLDTPYDISGKPTHDGWFTFANRSLRKSDQCVDLKDFRWGDQSINLNDALLPSGNVLVPISLNMLKKQLAHIFLLDDTGVRMEILRGLDVKK
jgi:pimeloyl-ACP methyl ester carboxylesterase